MIDGAASPPRSAAEVVRLPVAEWLSARVRSGRASGALDLHQIRAVLALYLAGRTVPPAVLQYAVEEVCRLIDEALPASFPSDPH